MGTTTFTGPIKAGPIPNTSGTTLGSDVANVGHVVMAQSADILQVSAGEDIASPTSIVIPANSRILGYDFFVKTAFTGGYKGFQIYNGTDTLVSTFLSSGLAENLGLLIFPVGGEPLNNNTGALDMRICFVCINSGAGEGTLTVRYMQGVGA